MNAPRWATKHYVKTKGNVYINRTAGQVKRSNMEGRWPRWDWLLNVKDESNAWNKNQMTGRVVTLWEQRGARNNKEMFWGNGFLWINNGRVEVNQEKANSLLCLANNQKSFSFYFPLIIKFPFFNLFIFLLLNFDVVIIVANSSTFTAAYCHLIKHRGLRWVKKASSYFANWEKDKKRATALLWFQLCGCHPLDTKLITRKKKGTRKKKWINKFQDFLIKTSQDE